MMKSPILFTATFPTEPEKSYEYNETGRHPVPDEGLCPNFITKLPARSMMAAGPLFTKTI